MGRTMRRWVVVALAAAVLAACGDSDESDGGVPATADVATTAAPAEPAPTTAAAAPVAGDGDGLVGEIMRPTLGLTASDIGVPADQVACMNEFLVEVFPDGLPADIPSSEEAGDALDAAAEACGVSLR